MPAQVKNADLEIVKCCCTDHKVIDKLLFEERRGKLVGSEREREREREREEREREREIY